MESGPLVCVTGASGWLAGFIIKQLLEEGYRSVFVLSGCLLPKHHGFDRVRGTVRDVSVKAKYEHLWKFPEASLPGMFSSTKLSKVSPPFFSGRLSFVSASLESDPGWDAAVDGEHQRTISPHRVMSACQTFRMQICVSHSESVASRKPKRPRTRGGVHAYVSNSNLNRSIARMFVARSCFVRPWMVHCA